MVCPVFCSGRRDFEVVPLLYCWYGAHGTEQEYDTRSEETFIIDAEIWRDLRDQYSSELNELPIRLSDFPAYA
jgi:hypothetical protein